MFLMNNFKMCTSRFEIQANLKTPCGQTHRRQSSVQYQITFDGILKTINHISSTTSYYLTILGHAESYVKSAYESSWQRVKELREDIFVSVEQRFIVSAY